MANDLETMRERLRDKLSDIEDETWNAGEKDEILQWAVRQISARLPRPVDPTTVTISLTNETYFYAIDPLLTSIERVDYLDDNLGERGPLMSGWEVVGDLLAGNAKLHVSPQITDGWGGRIRLVGQGRYTLPAAGASQATAIPDDYVPLVLAIATADAYSRLAADRARFQQWINTNQVQNVSVNELIQMQVRAEMARDQEWARLKRWPKPTLARL